MSQKNDTTEPEAPQAVSSQFSEQVVEERLTPNPLSQFSMDKDALRLALVTAQYALRATGNRHRQRSINQRGCWYSLMGWSRQARVPLLSN
nr:hypothetical protein [Psychrobacter sp. KH172YL61]